jgi:hypothetical protein
MGMAKKTGEFTEMTMKSIRLHFEQGRIRRIFSLYGGSIPDYNRHLAK